MKNRKTTPHSAGPDSAHGPGTAGLAHGYFDLAGPANGTTCAHAAVTACGAATVARLTGGVPGDKVLPTTTGTLPVDGPVRWGGQNLTAPARAEKWSQRRRSTVALR
jgi:hypothetical protein